jgi:hypothetical protein
MEQTSDRKTVYDSDFGPKYVLEDSGTMKRVVEEKEKKTSPQSLAAAAILGAGVAAAVGAVVSAPVVVAAATFVGIRYGLSKLFKD